MTPTTSKVNGAPIDHNRSEETSSLLSTIWEAIQDLSPQLRVIRGLKNRTINFLIVDPKLKTDREVVLTAVKVDGLNLQYISGDLEQDEEVILAAVMQNGLALQYAGKNFQNDRKIVGTAITQNGEALQYANTPFRDNQNYVRAAVEQNAKAFQYATDKLRNASGVIWWLNNHKILKYLSKELRNDKALIRHFLGADPLSSAEALRLIAAGVLLSDPLLPENELRYLIHEGIERQPNSLRHLNQEELLFILPMLQYLPRDVLSFDEDFIKKLIDRDVSALDLFPNAPHSIILAAVQQNGLALQYAHQVFRDNEEIVNAAVKQNPSSRKYASDNLQVKLKTDAVAAFTMNAPSYNGLIALTIHRLAIGNPNSTAKPE